MTEKQIARTISRTEEQIVAMGVALDYLKEQGFDPSEIATIVELMKLKAAENLNVWGHRQHYPKKGLK